MLFFNRILKEPESESQSPRVERRRTRRYAISQKFPLTAVLSFVPRDDTGAPMSESRRGWNWKGRLLDCSEHGARIQMGPTLKVSARDLCDLRLTVEEFELTIPCHIANLREQAEGMVFGLQHDIADEETRSAYRQLLDVLALGSTLKLQSQATKPDASGYVVERYVSDRPSRLSIWRHPADQSVAAFEFQLMDSLVRAAAGYGIEYLTAADARPASAARALEIQRLFHWVLSNLSPAIPADVRTFLEYFAD